LENKFKIIDDFVTERNQAKPLFTAGPASLLAENLSGLRPCFGRGDAEYCEIEEQVLDTLKKMSGHQNIVRMQGSASLALEIMALNFLYGRVLIVTTGYYSNRLESFIESAQRRLGEIKHVLRVNWDALDEPLPPCDWVVACYTETSRGLKIPIDSLHALSRRLGARLMLDATASIGLEDGHELAEVIGYSSCKGLFGLTGASFIAFNAMPSVRVDSFYLALESHLEKKMTGPFHAILSLVDVLPKHADFKAAVVVNKDAFVAKMTVYLTLPPSFQPLLCTHVNCQIATRDSRVVLYTPRTDAAGSVVCHLGEVYLGRQAHGRILDHLHIAQSSDSPDWV